MVRIIHGSDAMARLVDASEEYMTLATGFRFTEGPVWDPRDRSLTFSDIQNDSRWRWTAEAGAVLLAKPNRIGNGMFLARDGSRLVCEHVTSSVIREYPNGRFERVAFEYEGRYLNSPNDVIERSDGVVYFSDPDYGRWDHPVGIARKFELGFQGLFMVPSGGGAVRLAAPETEFDQPNGLCFSPDESILYVDDLDGIRAYDVAADGSLSGGRQLHTGMGDTSNPGRGNPDGLRCDEEGNLWCAARGGVWVLSPQGDLLGIIETEETTANLVWGGDDWHTLFICMGSKVKALTTLVRGVRTFGELGEHG